MPMTARAIESSRLGIGLYSIPEAAHLAKIRSIQRIRRWLDPDAGVVRGASCERTITFLDLMELHFVQMFREAGVSLQTIRLAAKTAERRFKCSHPFTLNRFDTDGDTIFGTLIRTETKTKLLEDLRHGQLVFDQVCRPFFKKLEYEGGSLARFWPLGTAHRVVVDPQRHFGQPIDSPTGVPTRALYKAVKAGDATSVVATWFDVPKAAVAAAVAFEESLTA
jgi:uncharacterized protein (DUF433 family)